MGGDHANPEYRIADDIRVATDAPVDFVTGITSALLSAATFIVVLWTIGGALTFTLAGTEITVPGFLVIAAVIYALLASGAMMLIGRGFVTASEKKNQAEAEYRYVLTRLRENGESIAVLGGEDEERRAADQSLNTVLHRWSEICRQTMRTTFVSQIRDGKPVGMVTIKPMLPNNPRALVRLGRVFFLACCHNLEQLVGKWTLELQRLFDRRGQPSFIFLFGRQYDRHRFGVHRLNDFVRVASEK